MSATTITVYYDGEWKKEEDSYRWFDKNNNMPIALVVDMEIKLAALLDKLYLKLGVDRSKIDMKLSFMSTAWDAPDPIYIKDDDDVFAFLIDRDEKNRRGSLRVGFIRKIEDDKQDQIGASVVSLDDLEDGILHDGANQENNDNNENKNCDDGIFMETNVLNVVSAVGVEKTNLTTVEDSSVVPHNQGTLASASIMAPTSTSYSELESYVAEDVEPTHVEDLEPIHVEDLEPTHVEDFEPTHVEDLEPIHVEDLEPIHVKDHEPIHVQECEPIHVEDCEPIYVEDLEPIHVQDCEPIHVQDREPIHVETPASHSFTDGTDFKIGQNFKSKAELKNNLLEAALKNCFEMKIIKSCKKVFVVKCVDDEHCKWKLRAIKVVNSNFFTIRTYYNTHTCTLEKRKKKHRQASAALVADTVKKNFQEIKQTLTPKGIMGMMSLKGVEITYWKAWKGKQMANNLWRGSPEESFEMLPCYLYMAKKVNPGTITHLEVDENKKFKYLFLAFGATIRGVSCMRKVISIDGTFLKSKYKGTLLVATAQDGNRHCYPIAWCVVDSENDSSWTWFLTKLQEIIPDDDELVFISDRNKSIKNAVSNVYKNAYHGYCMWHIEQNLKGRFYGMDAIDLFKTSAEAYQVSRFNESWSEIQNRYPGVAAYLTNNMDVSNWSRAYFGGNRYNIMTTGAVESINHALKDFRAYPLISMLDAIQELMSDWFYKHRNEAASCNTVFTPIIEATLRDRFIEAQKMIAKPLDMFEFNVTGGELNAVVDLSKNKCACRVFDLDRLPCAHALAAMKTLEYVRDYGSHYYTVDTWSLAYSEKIYPVPPMSEWDIPEEYEFAKFYLQI